MTLTNYVNTAVKPLKLKFLDPIHALAKVSFVELKKFLQLQKIEMKWADSTDCYMQVYGIWFTLNQKVKTTCQPLDPAQSIVPAAGEFWNKQMGFVDDMSYKLSFAMGMFTKLKLHAKLSLRYFAMYLYQAMTHWQSLCGYR